MSNSPPHAASGTQARVGALDVAPVLYDFINDEVLPGTSITRDRFWYGLEDTLERFTDWNHALLARRDELQRRIDDGWRSDRAVLMDPGRHEQWLRSIGYLVPKPADMRIATLNTDVEIAQVAGPQLVVPVSNARYAVNAANG